MGLFYKKASNSDKAKARKENKIPVEVLHEKRCQVCYLDEADLNSPKMEPKGPKNAEIYVIGASPSENDDDNHKHFSGEVGGLVRRYIPAAWKRDVRFGYITRCHTTSTKTSEIITHTEACKNFLLEDIEQVKPKVIIGVGNEPLKLFHGSGGQMQSWRGRRFPVRIGDHECWYFQIDDPLFVYMKQNVNRKTKQRYPGTNDDFMKRDLRTICTLVENEALPEAHVPTPDEYLEGCEWVEEPSNENLNKVIDWLEELLDENDVSLDIETTDLRPYNDGRILSVAIGTFDKTYGFLLDHSRGWDRKQRKKLKDTMTIFLEEYDGEMSYHNGIFELEWLIYNYGVDAVLKGNIQHHCTMAGAYVLDNRKGMLNLDTQMWLQHGLDFKAISNVDRTKLEQEPIDKLLKYNCMDTKWTHSLRTEQRKHIKKEDLESIYLKKRRNMKMLAKAQLKGIDPNEDALHRFDEQLTTELDDIASEMQALTEVKRFKRKYGHKFNPGSDKDLEFMFKDILQRPEVIKKDPKTKKEKTSTDEETLKSMPADEVPLAPLILKYRRPTKLRSTYVHGIMDLIYNDGKLHTSYNQLFTATGRLSSNDPNCFPDTVEVLTDSGWHNFGSVPENSLIAQYDTETQEIDFATPIDTIEQEYTGDLIHLKTDFFIDIISTPNHRFPLIDRKNKKPRNCIAENYHKDALQPCSGKHSKGTVSLRNSQITLLCALQADGSVTPNGSIDWSFYKDRKKERLLQALDSENIPYKQYPTTYDNKDRYYISFKDIPEWLSKKKEFDWDILNYDEQTLSTFCNELWHWDGDFTRNATWVSVVKKNADIVQAAFTLNGARATVQERSNATCDSFYVVNVTHDKTHQNTANHTKERIPYSGKIYCYTMPKDTLIVRHNGKVIITNNSQNFPKRKDKWIREVIRAPEGHKIVSVDYGQIEARCFGMASEDKVFCDALWNDLDVHQDWALRIVDAYDGIMDHTIKKYEMDPNSDDKAVIKKIRGDAKNGWVFPQFFGAGHFSCARNMAIPNDIAEKLAKEFWEEFEGVKKWQDGVIDLYKKKGYVETLGGFRRHGVMTYNEAINAGIQGTACEIVLNGMCDLSEMDYEPVQAVMQIHDDLTFYLPDESLEKDLDLIARTMCECPFDYINVPLVAEAEVGTHWANQKVYGEYYSNKGWVMP